VIASANLHPIVIGIVLGAVVSAVMVRRNFTRVERINAELLAG
jgi:xanthine/uracil permease